MSSLKRAVLSAAFVVGTLAIPGTPASAHNNDGSNSATDAVHRGCGAGYDYIKGTWLAIHIEGKYAGGVILARAGQYSDNFCVVTYKVTGWQFHGHQTWVEAHIWRKGENRLEDEGDFLHLAAMKIDRDSTCLGYAGYLENEQEEGQRQIGDYPHGCLGQ